MASKDIYYVTITCPNCPNEAKVQIVENDGRTFIHRGAEQRVSNIDGDISISKNNIKCGKCKHEWIDNFFQ